MWSQIILYLGYKRFVWDMCNQHKDITAMNAVVQKIPRQTKAVFLPK